MDRFDVAIVGAGPAGCRAAFRMAGAGARVAILDGSHPREKPCGGGVTGARARPRAGRDRPARVRGSPDRDGGLRARRRAGLQHVPIRSARPRRPLVVGRVAAAIRRRPARRRVAGPGRTLIPARVTDVTAHRDGWVVATRDGALSAAWLLGADGPNSLVRRRVLRPFDRADLSIATGFFVHGPTSREIAIAFSSGPSTSLRAGPPGTSGRFRGRIISRSASARRPMRARRRRCCRARRGGSAGTSKDPWTWCGTAGRSRRCASRRCSASSRPARVGCCSATPAAWWIRSRVKGSSSRCCQLTPPPTAFSAATTRPRSIRAHPDVDSRGAHPRRAAEGPVLQPTLYGPHDPRPPGERRDPPRHVRSDRRPPDLPRTTSAVAGDVGAAAHVAGSQSLITNRRTRFKDSRISRLVIRILVT